MVNDPTQPRKHRRRLSTSEKHELYASVLSGQSSQREAADRWKVNRATAAHICRTAKQGALDALAAAVPGRPGQSAEQAAIAAAREEVAAGHRRRTGRGDPPCREKSALALSAGPVPPRVDGDLKAGLLNLVDQAVEQGWSARRAAGRLGLDDARCSRWLAPPRRRPARRPGS
jgi:transposase-like protein